MDGASRSGGARGDAPRAPRQKPLARPRANPRCWPSLTARAAARRPPPAFIGDAARRERVEGGGGQQSGRWGQQAAAPTRGHAVAAPLPIRRAAPPRGARARRGPAALCRRPTQMVRAYLGGGGGEAERSGRRRTKKESWEKSRREVLSPARRAKNILSPLLGSPSVQRAAQLAERTAASNVTDGLKLINNWFPSRSPLFYDCKKG